jgi:hypothetical protein
MTYIPYAPEMNCMYTLTGPSGVIATFNNSSDANYVGVITELDGLDSSGVRENGDSLVEQDGGWHGNFWYDRRPITLSGTVYGHASATARAAKIDLLRQASNALRSDAVLSWTPSATGSVAMQTWVRRQQPLKISGGWNKDFQLLLVSQYAQLFSSTLYSATPGPASCENHGDYASAPLITIAGPSTNPVTVTNTTTGLLVKYLNTIASGHSVVIDVLNHVATLDGTTDVSGSLDFVNSTWPMVAKGVNTFTLTGGGTLTVQWRDNWA